MGLARLVSSLPMGPPGLLPLAGSLPDLGPHSQFWQCIVIQVQVCVCVLACVRACMHVCVCVCVSLSTAFLGFYTVVGEKGHSVSGGQKK